MADPTNPPTRSSFNDDGNGFVVGFMCRIAFECELGATPGGTRIYPSLENLRTEHSCSDDCGIVEVEVRCKSIIVEGSHNG